MPVLEDEASDVRVDPDAPAGDGGVADAAESNEVVAVVECLLPSAAVAPAGLGDSFVFFLAGSDGAVDDGPFRADFTVVGAARPDDPVVERS